MTFLITPELDATLAASDLDAARLEKTREIKQLIREAHVESQQSGAEVIVAFAPGEYVIHPDAAPIPIYPGLTYNGYGATILRSAMPAEPELHEDVLDFLHSRFNTNRTAGSNWAHSRLALTEFRQRLLADVVEQGGSADHFNNKIDDWEAVHGWMTTMSRWHWINEFASKDDEVVTHRGDTDSRPVTIRGFRFDGREADQWGYTRYELEHAACLSLFAHHGGGGRLIVNVDDCHFRKGVADGIHLGSNVISRVRRCSSLDCFRGGFSIAGSNSIHRIEQFDARGELRPSSVQVETEASRQRPVLVKLSDIDTDHFDIHTKEGHGGLTVRAERIRSRTSHEIWPDADSNVVIRDSEFVQNGTSSKIHRAHRLRFENCRFGLISGRQGDSIVQPDIDSPDFRANLENEWSCATIVRSKEDHRSVEFLDCVFECVDRDSYATGRVTLVTVAPQPVRNERGPLSVPVRLRRCRFLGHVDFGCNLPQGGSLDVDGLEVDIAGAVFRLAEVHNPPHAHFFYTNLAVRRIDIRRAQEYAVHIRMRMAESTVRHSDTLIDASHSAIRVVEANGHKPGVHPTTAGGRRIRGPEADPNRAEICGYPGDTYTFFSERDFNGNPNGGLWFCVASRIDDDGRLRGIWKPVSM